MARPKTPAAAVIASYSVQVRLHERPDRPRGTYERDYGPVVVPTGGRLQRLIADRLYDDLPYFRTKDIEVVAKRTDAP